MLTQGYALPLNEPWDVIYDGSGLWVLFGNRLVKLELVEAEKRFRAAEQVELKDSANSLTWDASRGKYWTVCGSNEIYRVDRAGNTIATFTAPQTVGYPRLVTWDGGYLWVTAGSALYKLQLVSDSGELKVIDSYAPSTGRFPNREAAGLTWDGNQLWLLVDDILSKLNQAVQPICKIELPSAFPQPSLFGYRGVAWDGQSLWVAHKDTNKLYRVDPAACR